MKYIKLYTILSALLFTFGCQESSKILHPTFAEHIAPIVHRSCTPCHKPQQIGHFDLITYQDVVSQKDQIWFTISNRIMPPWPADIHYTEFIGQNTLTDEEIKLFKIWIDNSCPQGDTSHLPSYTISPERSFLGKPDYVIPVIPTHIEGNFSDQFLLIKVPFELPSDTFIRAVEFVPGNTKVVHHVNGDMVKFTNEKKKNVFDGTLVSNMVLDSTIVLAYQKIGLLHDDGSFPILSKSVVNYLPGVIAQQYPDGIGGWKAFKKNAFVLSDLHYGPSLENTWDSSYINIFLSKTHPDRPLKEFQMGTLGISPIVPPLIIPPNTVKKYTTRTTLQETISVLTINPHMHLLGKSFKAYALKPNGDTIRLIHIPKWNFNWQFFYTFKKMIVIPKGSTIIVEGEFDNTEDNPFNPFHPPRVVKDNKGSMRTTDEMFQFIVTYLPYRKGDEDFSLERN
ncbi:MAG: hypothetical protein R2831_04950 [Chitinophagaceae bacterium]